MGKLIAAVCALFSAVAIVAVVALLGSISLMWRMTYEASEYAEASCTERASWGGETEELPGVPYGYEDDVLAAAEEAGVPPSVIAAQIGAESGWNEDAVSPAGAAGLAQFMPGTWEMYGEGDRTDGAASIAAQGRYMKALMDLAAPHADDDGHQLKLALAAYNWGPGNMESNGWKLDGIPTETANYIPKIATDGQDFYSAGCAPVADFENIGDLGDGEWTHPLPGSSLTSGYGRRNVVGLPDWAQNHVGLDFATPGGGPVVAPIDMRITNVYDADGCVLGKATTGPDFGFAFCHMDSSTVSTGDKVKRGDVIGVEGTKATSVGTSVARHLHFELYHPDAADPKFPGPDAPGVIDPSPILKAKGVL